MRFSVTGNILDIPKPRSVWDKYFGDKLTVSFLVREWNVYADIVPAKNAKLRPIRLASETLSAVGHKPHKKACALYLPIGNHISYFSYQAIVVSLPSIESSFTTHTTKSIQGFDHPKYPALRIAIEVLNAAESYLWVRSYSSSTYTISPSDQRHIRGSGLAYGASVQPDVEGGLLSFSLYRVRSNYYYITLILTTHLRALMPCKLSSRQQTSSRD